MHHLRKLYYAVKSVRSFKSVLCGPEAALAQTLCINAIQESVVNIGSFPESSLKPFGKNGIFVKNLYDVFWKCYNNSLLPSESECLWAKAGNRIDLTDYKKYPGNTYKE